MLKRRPLLFFFPLAFALSWYPWILALVQRSGPSGPNPLGVLVAALLVTGLAFGKTGLKDLFARLFRWRVGVQWYALVLLLPPVFCITAAGINILAGAPMPSPEKFRAWPGMIDRFIFIFLFIGLGEEPGWRGFALEQLQKNRTPLAASAILACVWAFWHLPLMGTEFTLPVIPAFLLSVFAATFILTWMYNRTRGSILLPMILHSTVNTVGAGFLFPMFTGADSLRLWYIYSALCVVFAAALIASGKLSHNPRMSLQPSSDLNSGSPVAGTEARSAAAF